MALSFYKRLTALFLALSILAPFPYVLIIPQYAFAQERPVGGTSAKNINSWGQAAASGAVSLGSCIAAAGLTLGDAVTGALGGAFGAAISGAGSYISGVFDSIFGTSQIGGNLGIGSAIGKTNAEGQAITAGASTGGGTGAGAAGAAVSVPVADAGATIQRATISTANLTALGTLIKIQLGIATKKNVFDCIAWAIAKMIWRAIAASIIDWINGGFNGKPAFIQNFDRFLLGIADSIAGEVIQGVGLGFLCSPFQLNIRIALAQRYAQRGAPSCTLTQVIANVENFMKNFKQGGWGAWLQFTTAPQNNAFGGMLLGEATIAIRTQNAQSQQSQQLSWGSGFLSLTKQTCKSVPVSVNGMTPQNTEQCTSSIQTPGELIAHKLGSTVDAPELSLLMSNEINQIIDALSQQLLTQALSGLFSLSQSKSYGDDYYRFATPTADLSQQGTNTGGGVSGASDLIDQINVSIDNEFELQDQIDAALNIIDASLADHQSIKSCWLGKSSGPAITFTNSTSTVADGINQSEAVAQVRVQDQNLTLSNSRRTQFADGLTQSTLTVQALRALVQSAREAQNASQLATVVQEYTSKKIAGVYANSAMLSTLAGVVERLRTDPQTSAVAARQSLLQCQYFPEPVPPHLLTTATSGPATFNAAPLTGRAPLSVGLYVNAPANNTTYTLEFGDGASTSVWPNICESATGSCIATQHTYSSVGTYVARVYSCSSQTTCTTATRLSVGTTTITATQ